MGVLSIKNTKQLISLFFQPSTLLFLFKNKAPATCLFTN